MKKIKSEVEQKIAEMLEGEFTVRQIAEKLNLSIGTVQKRKKKMKNAAKKPASEVIGDQLFFPDAKPENKVVEKIKSEIVDEIAEISELTKKYNADVEKIRQEYKIALISIISGF